MLSTIVATVLDNLEAMRQDSRLELVTVDAVLQALMVVYERQLAAYHAEVRQDGGAGVDTGGSPRGWREDGAQEQPAHDTAEQSATTAPRGQGSGRGRTDRDRLGPQVRWPDEDLDADVRGPAKHVVDRLCHVLGGR